MKLLRLAKNVARSLSCISWLALTLLPGHTLLASDSNTIENSVVKVFSTIRNPDPSRPWTKQPPGEATGSGVVIEGHRILTNAHVVRYASQVQIQANQAGDKLSAKVLAVAPGIDLAVLQLDDESFFDTHPAVLRANKMPEIKDAVLAYGYPTGGAALSITKGIVSRIEFVPYSIATSGLRIQIDAAINPGNSGGPAIAGDRMIGLAFSKLNQANNIGYIIPNEEIELFLADIADGHYDGKPALYLESQTLENPSLRAYLKVEKSTTGIVVQRNYGDRAAPVLQRWDVITKIGDMAIDDQGMIKVSPSLRLAYQYWIQRIAKDGKVPLTIFRGGKSQSALVPVALDRPLVMPELAGSYPPYFIYGPLVFSKATIEFLGVAQARAAARPTMGFMGSPLVTRFGQPPRMAGEELVVVSSPLFPNKIAQGYDSPVGSVVRAVNGTKIDNLKQLVKTLRDLKDEFVIVEFDQDESETLVLRRADIAAATEEILSDNGVRAQGSPELLAVWNDEGGAH